MSKREKWLAALPVFNEVNYVDDILDKVKQHAENVLVVDDGSTDGTSALLEKRTDLKSIRHEKNQGYGAALQTAFRFAIDNGFDGVVTLDLSLIHI